MRYGFGSIAALTDENLRSINTERGIGIHVATLPTVAGKDRFSKTSVSRSLLRCRPTGVFLALIGRERYFVLFNVRRSSF